MAVLRLNTNYVVSILKPISWKYSLIQGNSHVNRKVPKAAAQCSVVKRDVIPLHQRVSSCEGVKGLFGNSIEFCLEISLLMDSSNADGACGKEAHQAPFQTWGVINGCLDCMVASSLA